MKKFLTFLITFTFCILFTTYVRSGADEEFFRDYFQGEDRFHVQKILFLINYHNFCVLPRVSLATYQFFQAFYRQLGVDKVESEKTLFNDTFLLNRTFEYDPSHYRIPLKSHRVWITSQYNPREMVDVLVNQTLQEKLNSTNKVLDESAITDEAVRDGSNKWTHYFWVNDKSLVPKSVKFMESIGYVVRELKELQIFDGVLLEALNYYQDTDRVGAAADFVRMAINYEEGGFYIDLDFYLDKWDIQIHKYFDFFGFRCVEFNNHYTLFTWGFLSKPAHYIHKIYLDLFKKNYLLQKQGNLVKKPIHLMQCHIISRGSTLFDTGPYFYDAAYIRTFEDKMNDQIFVIPDISYEIDTVKNITFNNGSNITLRISGLQLGQGSWASDYLDATRFGWPELQRFPDEEL
ncbi:UNKNOWN [Stylonychia lemnae]|uniref:Surface protein Sur1 n=1 Tax=Stylonychia lemnae TaxID=5949 RepID=A0A077ZPU4_STYLE|nr:UNKNOWN [Stylonychia lemnae]|eukprot:CDW71395.1 UNKNOWN [Stylonychia lemnae]